MTAEYISNTNTVIKRNYVGAMATDSFTKSMPASSTCIASVGGNVPDVMAVPLRLLISRTSVLTVGAPELPHRLTARPAPFPHPERPRIEEGIVEPTRERLDRFPDVFRSAVTRAL